MPGGVVSSGQVCFRFDGKASVGPAANFFRIEEHDLVKKS
jgi:hypothetical protein